MVIIFSISIFYFFIIIGIAGILGLVFVLACFGVMTDGRRLGR